MDKRLQKEILTIIKESNNNKEKGPTYLGLMEEVFKKLENYDNAVINHNLNLLKESGKINYCPANGRTITEDPSNWPVGSNLTVTFILSPILMSSNLIVC